MMPITLGIRLVYQLILLPYDLLIFEEIHKYRENCVISC